MEVLRPEEEEEEDGGGKPWGDGEGERLDMASAQTPEPWAAGTVISATMLSLCASVSVLTD
jgi:hypothetical protein